MTTDHRVILRVPEDTRLADLPPAERAAIEAVGAQFMAQIKYGTRAGAGWKLVDAITRVPVTPALLASAGLAGWTIVYQARATNDAEPRAVEIVDALDAAVLAAHLAPAEDGTATAWADPSLPAGWPPCTDGVPAP